MAELFLGLPVRGSSAQAASTNAGGAVSVAFAASTRGRAHHLMNVVWYAGAPTTATQLRVYDGTSSGPVVLNVGSSIAAVQQLTFPAPLRGTPGSAMTVQLSSGGAGNMWLNAYSISED